MSRFTHSRNMKKVLGEDASPFGVVSGIGHKKVHPIKHVELPAASTPRDAGITL